MRYAAKLILIFVALSIIPWHAHSQSSEISILLPEKPMLTSKPFVVSLKNQTTNLIMFCADFTAKTSKGIAPQPDFQLMRKSGRRWIPQLEEDVGHVLASDSIAPKESKSYSMQIAHPGTYQLILQYKEGTTLKGDCSEQTSFKLRARSGIFNVSRAGLKRPNQ